MVSTRGCLEPDPVRGGRVSTHDNSPMVVVGSRARWALVVFPIAFLIALVAWALTSPAGSAPDDDYHLSSIWCAGGERAGACETDPGDLGVWLVPQSVGFAHECFAYDATVTAACTDANTDALLPTDRVNEIAGLYPSGFYRVMGLFTGPDVGQSVVVMRLLNALLAVGLLTLALRVLSPAIRSALVVVVLVVYVPLGLFIIPSTNPSSWTLTGITFLWAFGLALAHRRDWRSRRTWVLAVATVVSAGLAIASRVDAAAYVTATVAVIALLTGRQRLQRAWISTLVLAVLALIGLVQFATFGTPGSGVSGGMGGTEPGPGLFLANVIYLPVYISGAVGSMALGWNDTPLPPLVFVFGTLVLGAITYRGIQKLPRNKVLAVLFALFIFVAVPLVFLQREGLGVGEVVQARYLLPLMVVLFATVSVALPIVGRKSTGLPLPNAAAWLIGIAVAASASVSLWVNAHRYAAGSTRGLFDLDLQMEWSGIVALPLTLIVAVGVIATMLYVVSGVVVVRQDARC